MKSRKFAVLLHGTGYDICDEQGRNAGGFYVTVFVAAHDQDSACAQALDLLVASEQFASACGAERHPHGAIAVDGVDELTSFAGVPWPMTGFSFYLQDAGHGEGNAVKQ
jgi:hypothetical protein